MALFLRRPWRFLAHMARDDRGGVAAYSAVFAVLAVGAGALAVDTGRIAVLRGQMQNRADAAALAGAVQLDGRVGAQGRAEAVARDGAADVTALASDGQTLAVQSVAFYSAIDPAPVAATGDEDSKFVEVVLEPRQIDMTFGQALISTTSGAARTARARAVATSQPYICHAPPLMVCNPGETDPAADVALPANAGRQLLIKPALGDDFWAPGNYGLLALPDGSSGASAIEGALAAVTPADCYNLDVITTTGVKTDKVQNGINARFDLPGGLPYPAPNVIHYPRDPEIAASTEVGMGSGTWDIAEYWFARHGGGVPADLDGASRYQVYLYELGLEFARKGRQTIHPITGTLPDGYVVVTSPAPSIPEDPLDPGNPVVDGMPSQTVAGNGQARRLVQVAVLQCEAEQVRGKHTYPTHGNFVEMFLTEAVPDAPAGGIFGEIVRPLTTVNHPDFHANVRLVR